MRNQGERMGDAKRVLRALCVGAVLGTAGGPAAANLIVNGSFEIGPAIVDAPLFAGSTEIPGWVVGANQIDYTSPANWQPSDGIRSIDLDGSSLARPFNGAISQTFATTVGLRYTVSFDLSGNPAGGTQVKHVEVSAGDALLRFSHDLGAEFPQNAPPPPLQITFLRHSFLFTALDVSTTLSFVSLTPEFGGIGFGAVLDNVVVTPANAVPEPATLLLLALGLSALGSRRLRATL